MLPPERFARYVPDEPDMWRTPPVLRLEDLVPCAGEPDASEHPPLSIIMVFSNYRKSQLARSLECLARQTWREFEVIIVDNGSTDGTPDCIPQFEPYVPGLRVIRIERKGFTACPSAGIKVALPEARGRVIAIMQPEVMLVPDAARFLYEAHFHEQPGATSMVISRPYRDPLTQPRRWVSLRIGFLGRQAQANLDGIDWHSNAANVESDDSFWRHSEGLGNKSNPEWAGRDMPYWFVGSALADDSIWDDMPLMFGHGTIDLYLLNYRYLFGYRDITPPGFYGYHQYHLRTAIAPIADRGEFEQYRVSVDGILAWLDSRGRWPDGMDRQPYISPDDLRFSITSGPRPVTHYTTNNLGKRVRVAVQPGPREHRGEDRTGDAYDPYPKIIPGWTPPDDTPTESVRIKRAKGDA